MEFNKLVKYINETNISSFASQLPYALFVVDKNSKYAFVNQVVVENLALKDADAGLGISHGDFNIPSIVLSGVYTKYDKEVVETGKVVRHLGRFGVANDKWITCVLTRSPFCIDNEQVGATITYHDISNINAINYGLLNYKTEKSLIIDNIDKQFDYRIENYDSSLSISSRESEVLFYLLRGKTATEISGICYISPRTVEKHIQNIKVKMNVKSRSEIIEKAVAEGLANTLPASLLRSLS